MPGHFSERSDQDKLRHNLNRLQAFREGKAKFAMSGAEPGDVVAVNYRFEGFLQPLLYGVLQITKGDPENPLEISVNGQRIKFHQLVAIEVIQKAKKS